MNLAPELQRILRETPELQRAFLVGGCVRDALLGLPAGKDYDIEVFGVEYDRLMAALSRWGRTDLVGRSFGVVKLSTGSGCQYDFSLPRRDSKVAPGHKGFRIEFDAAITLPEAAGRRDFTINSLMYDPRTGEVLDFFGGRADLENRVLRHASEAFAEDPLRVLRGMQFAGRFDLKAAPETVALCRRIKGSYAELAVERVREEWFKWAQRSERPSAGLRFLVDTEWAGHFPEIQALNGTVQEPEWHPEGDVFTHTCHCCDALAGLEEWRRADAESRIVYMLAILAHDFGKPATTHRARATPSFGPKARAAVRSSDFARTRSPSCAIAMPRSASAGASSRRATRFNAPRRSPAARARAAAVISESIGIPPRLSLPPFETRR